MIIIMSNEINHFIQTLDSEDGVHKNTIISYKYDINQFGNFIKRRKKSFKSIIKKDIIDFLNSLKQKKVKNKTKSRKIFALKRFYKFLISEKIIKNNPIEKIDIPKSEDTLSNNSDELKEKNIEVAGDVCVAQYNGPTTIPPFRKNEILIPISYK